LGGKDGEWDSWAPGSRLDHQVSVVGGYRGWSDQPALLGGAKYPPTACANQGDDDQENQD
jgi:hypothetical protein